MAKQSTTEIERYAGIAKTIRERRSIKNHYKNDPVPGELVVELLNDAVWAPNHGLREPWKFIFVSTEQKQIFIDDCFKSLLKVKRKRCNSISGK